MFSSSIARLLAASVIAAIIGVTGTTISSNRTSDLTSVALLSSTNIVTEDDVFTVTVSVTAPEPVNVFDGLITFDPAKLQVDSISYNTSLADLWAEEPWYQNGAGTVGFIGGTTRTGGFTGTETLLTINFRATESGATAIALSEINILYHDGYGTDAPVAEPLDLVVTVRDPALTRTITTNTVPKTSDLVILPPDRSTDLNGDGEQTFVDVSIFMFNIAGNNPRYDFNNDGQVNTKDLSIILNAK